MIIVEGMNVFPSQIEEALLEVEGVEPHYQIILSRQEGLDALEIQVEVSKAFPVLDEPRGIMAFKRNIEEHLASNLGFNATVTLVEPKSLLRSSGEKLKRVVDMRED